MFFLILVAIMPFAIGPDLNLLARLGPAILWIAALLSTLLGLDRLFQADADDGSLDVLVNAALPLEVVVLVKCAAHWTTSALPLIVVSPLFGLMLGDGRRRRSRWSPLTLARRHAGADHDRRDRRGADGLAAARRPADGGAGAAADDPGADLRRLRRLGGERRRGAVPDAVPDALRALAVAIAAAPFAAAAALRHVRE